MLVWILGVWMGKERLEYLCVCIECLRNICKNKYISP